MRALKAFFAGFAVVVLAALVIVPAAGCKKPFLVKSAAEEINADYKELTGRDCIVYSPKEMTKADFLEKSGLSKKSVKDFYGLYSSEMGYNDTVICLRMADEKAAQKAAQYLTGLKEELAAQYRDFPINGSYQRAKDSMVVRRNEYVFYFCVGIMPEDNEEELDFVTELDIAIKAVNRLLSQ